MTRFLSMLMALGIASAAFGADCDCNDCPQPACVGNCSLRYIANLILPWATNFSQSAVISSGEGRLVLRRNQVLYTHLYTPVGATTQVKVFLPLKRFGETDLYFYRLPEPNQPMGGWVPCDFETSTGARDRYFEAYLACNTLPQLSKSELNQIIELFLPGCCCPIP
jgi:hypothetical protein